MERIEGGYILRDRRSTNGITLGDEDMSVIDLRNDSEVKVGDVKFGYTLSEEELDDLDDEDFVPHSRKAGEGSGKSSGEEKKSKPKKKAKANVVTTAPARPAAVAPVLASSNEGSGFLYGLALLVCGILAFYAGLDHSYSGKQRDAGRKGDLSLFGDIKDGRPPLPVAEEDTE